MHRVETPALKGAMNRVVVVAVVVAAVVAGMLVMWRSDRVEPGAGPAQSESVTRTTVRDASLGPSAAPEPSLPSNAESTSDVRRAASAPMEHRLARTRDAGAYQRALVDDFDSLAAELEQQMALDLGTAHLAEAYEIQISQLFEEQKIPSTVSRVRCGKQFCVAEIATPPNANPPVLRSSETRDIGLGLSIVATVSLATPGESTQTRILFSALRSPTEKP